MTGVHFCDRLVLDPVCTPIVGSLGRGQREKKGAPHSACAPIPGYSIGKAAINAGKTASLRDSLFCRVCAPAMCTPAKFSVQDPGTLNPELHTHQMEGGKGGGGAPWWLQQNAATAVGLHTDY